MLSSNTADSEGERDSRDRLDEGFFAKVPGIAPLSATRYRHLCPKPDPFPSPLPPLGQFSVPLALRLRLIYSFPYILYVRRGEMDERWPMFYTEQVRPQYSPCVGVTLLFGLNSLRPVIARFPSPPNPSRNQLTPVSWLRTRLLVPRPGQSDRIAEWIDENGSRHCPFFALPRAVIAVALRILPTTRRPGACCQESCRTICRR